MFSRLSIIQITSRTSFRKHNTINNIRKPALLCPYVFKRAKQGLLHYTIDYQQFAKHIPARNLYVIRENVIRAHSHTAQTFSLPVSYQLCQAQSNTAYQTYYIIPGNTDISLQQLIKSGSTLRSTPDKQYKCTPCNHTPWPSDRKRADGHTKQKTTD